MIWFYADVGFTESIYPTSLDQVTWTEKNTRFFIPESPIASSARYAYATTGETAQKMIDDLGEEYYTLYGLLVRYNSSRYEACNQIVPSTFLAYPVLNALRTNHYVVVYIKTTSSVILYSNTTGALAAKVDGATIGTYTSEASLPFGGVYQNAGFAIFHGPRNDLSTLENWTFIDYGYKTSSPNYFYNVYPYSDFSAPSQQATRRFLSVAFPNGTVPDGEGPIPPDNPYEPGGESGEGGGGGNFDDTSDPIPDSSLPTLSSSNTGFTRIYNPSLSQVQDLAQYLWTDESVIQTIWNHIKQFMENPMDAIIGFNLVPCAVPNGGTKEFALMYIGTGVQMTVAANQFVDVDCGTCELTEYFGSALDYAPYTKISCFLPYIGTVELNVDEVMKTTLQVKYRIDICSGSCVAKILVNGNVLYQYSGHCAISIPISAADFSSYVSAAISVAKLAIGAAVGGGMGAAAALSGDPSQQTNQIVTTTQTTETARNPATGRQITMGTRTTVETRESPADQSSTQASFSGLTPNNIANTVGQIMSSKPHVEHSGSFSGNTGYLGVRRPYLIITRPNQCMPNQYQQFNGFPSMISQELSGLSGFTKVQQVQLTGMSATNPEQAEILEFLKSGVIL